jgi:hypothetical protein
VLLADVEISVGLPTIAFRTVDDVTSVFWNIVAVCVTVSVFENTFVDVSAFATYKLPFPVYDIFIVPPATPELTRYTSCPDKPFGAGPVDPIGPVAPFDPAGPVAPVGPVAPTGPPDGPVAPVTPVAPVGPVAPSDPT